MIASIGYPPETIGIFLGMVLAMLAFDFWSHRESKIVSLPSACGWTIFYIVCAFAFAGYLHQTYGSEASSLFLTGYALEKVLAFDNLFVFALIFTYFKIDLKDQHKALYWGIAGAIVFRLIFVWLGVSFLEKFGTAVEVVFAAIILYTVYLMWTAGDDDAEDYNNTWYVKGIRKIYPTASTLFIAIVTIEISDILFSFDSVPAIIAITKDPLLIYSAMIFAILGLRSMFFVMSSLMRYFTYMDEAVMIVLVLIAGKLLAGAFGYHLDPVHSLGIILSVLAGGVVVSIIKREPDENTY